MAKIIFLGTAAAVASKTRDNTSVLVITNKDIILVDAPGALIGKLEKLSIDFRKISQIFITHSHPDHIYGIVSLLHSQYKLKNRVHIFAPTKVINKVKILRRVFELEDTSKYPQITYHRIEEGGFYNSDSLKVRAFKVRHAKESLGFKFLFKKERISCIFSGDTAFTPNLIKESRHADYLIHDCFSPEKFFRKYPQLYKMHTSSLILGKIAAESCVKVLVPIHFASEVEYSMPEIKKEIRKNFSGRIILPQDLKTLKLRHWPD